MKMNIKNIIGSLVLASMLYSCDTTNESGYEPSVYIQSTSLALAEVTASALDNSFEFTYTPTSAGTGYYAVVKSGTAAPSSTDVHSGSGFMQAGNFAVDGTTPVSITVDSDIYGNYTYDVYAIHKSDDNFISETVTKLSVTTPDTANPMFIKLESTPVFDDSVTPGVPTEEVSPLADVILQFTEPVSYEGGEIKFTAINSGREVIINDASAVTISGTTVTIDTHGTFEQNDFISVTWPLGTFKDNSDKSADELVITEYYFETRLFTASESAVLMEGTYNYSTVMYGGNFESFYTPNAGLFLPTTGEFELKLDPTDETGTTLLGINIISPLVDFGFPRTSANLKIKLGAGGLLTVLDEDQTSGVPLTDGDGNDFLVKWLHNVDGFDVDAGSYDVTAGTLTHFVSLVADNGSNAVLDFVDYNYTRVGTFPKLSSELKEKLEKRNKLLTEKVAQNETYKGFSFKVLNN